MDALEQQLTKETIIESNCQNAFKVLKTQFEKLFTSVLINHSSLDGTYARKDFHQRLDDKELRIQECTVQEVKASDAISEDKAQERCMVSFQLLHSHFKLLSNNDLKGTRAEYGFKRAFATLFGQVLETFTSTMLLNMDQLEKQLDNKEFQEIRSMAAFKHKREYESRVNDRQMQTIEEKVNTSKALDASLVDTKSSGTESVEQDTSSESGNDAHADDANIRPIYDEQPMAEVHTTAEINIFATG
nr:hypothetical protein [Tanacetum cinerariifolium]